MQIKQLCDRSEAMCGVNITAIFHVIIQSPTEFGCASFPIFVPIGCQVVAIGPHGIDDFAEKSLLCHAERIHFEEVITAVFEHHAVLSRRFRQVDECPNLAHVHRRRHFYGHMFAVVHGELSRREVMIPVGCDENQVDIIALARLFVALGSAINGRRREACLAQSLVGLVGT